MTVPDSPAHLETLRGSGMPERSATDRRRQPWDVQYVGGGDGDAPFAYTRGLWQAFGHAELFADTRPVSGGEDDAHWQLSTSDMGEVLNAFGERVRAGEKFAAGDSHDQLVDEGRTTLRWAFSEAAADWPSAHQVHPHAPVLHLSFSLRRQPVRAYEAPTAAALQILASKAERILEAAFGSPRSWGASEGSGGPFTEVLEALALLVEAGSEDDLLMVAGMAMTAAPWQNGALGAVSEEIRVSGRQKHFDWAQHRASDACDTALRCVEDPHERHSLKDGLMNALAGAMGAWVVADVIEEPLFHMAGGLVTGYFVGGQPAADGVEQIADELARRLRESTEKERTRVLRSLDRSESVRVRRGLIMRQQALARGFEPVWRRAEPVLPPEVDAGNSEDLIDAYETAVAALVLGDEAPAQDRNAALNPFRIAFKMRDTI